MLAGHARTDISRNIDGQEGGHIGDCPFSPWSRPACIRIRGPGDNTPISDIDFIVTMEHGASLFDQIRLQQHLTQYLGCSIDLLNMDGLTQAFDGKGDYRRQKILAEKIPL